jgi:DNA-binding transcriptional LysR family regulator
MNYKNIDIHLLRCFEALMDERSVSRAAERMHVSQPAMSHALARLRRHFDDPLLLRAQKEMVPTRCALTAREAVGRILLETENLFLRSIAFRPEDSRMKFVVTAPEFVEHVLAPKLLGRLQREAPGVTLEIRVPDPDRAVEWLEKGEIDFRMGWLRTPPPMLRSQLLFRDSFVCLARKGHPQIRGAISQERYFSLPHVRTRFVRNSTSGRVIDEVAAAHGGKLNVAVLMQNVFSMFHVVAHSDLIATVPSRLVQGVSGQLPIQVLMPPIAIPDIRINLFWHERTHQEASHRWFRQLLVEVAKSL